MPNFIQEFRRLFDWLKNESSITNVGGNLIIRLQGRETYVLDPTFVRGFNYRKSDSVSCEIIYEGSWSIPIQQPPAKVMEVVRQAQFEKMNSRVSMDLDSDSPLSNQEPEKDQVFAELKTAMQKLIDALKEESPEEANQIEQAFGRFEDTIKQQD